MARKKVFLSILMLLMVVGIYANVYAVSAPTTIKDVSGNENDAVVNGNVLLVAGEFGTGIHFSSNNSYISVPVDSKKDMFKDALDLSGKQTISFWFTPSTGKVSTEKSVYTIQKYGFDEYNTYIYGAAPYATGNSNSKYDATKQLTMSTYTKDGDIKEITIEKDWQENKWYHFTGTIDPENGLMKIYINGELEASENVGSFELKESNHDLTIGGTSGFYDYTRSSIDEFRVYNRILSDEEIHKIITKNTPIYKGLVLRLSF